MAADQKLVDLMSKARCLHRSGSCMNTPWSKHPDCAAAVAEQYASTLAEDLERTRRERDCFEQEMRRLLREGTGGGS